VYRMGSSLLTDLCIVTPVNDDAVLAANLLRSPAVAAGLPVKQMRGFRSAAAAYNAAMDESPAEIMVFCHQDVYLPRSWLTKLEEAIRAVEKIDKNWAVLGVYGVKADGAHVGKVWCSGGNYVLNPPANMPAAVRSVDELLFVLRRSSGIRFDEKLPGFHLYGTDIVQTALAAGLGAYVIDAPVIHNTAGYRKMAGQVTDRDAVCAGHAIRPPARPCRVIALQESSRPWRTARDRPPGCCRACPSPRLRLAAPGKSRRTARGWTLGRA